MTSDRRVPRLGKKRKQLQKRAAIPCQISAAATSTSLFDIPVSFDHSDGGKLPFGADVSLAIEEFALSLRRPKPGNSFPHGAPNSSSGQMSAVDRVRDALHQSLDFPEFHLIISLLFWTTLISTFRQEEFWELSPFRKKLGVTWQKFASFLRTKSIGDPVLKTLPFLLGQPVFRLICDVFPQAYGPMSSVSTVVVESMSVQCHYELCGFFAQRKTVQVLRQRYLIPPVCDHPHANQIIAAQRCDFQLTLPASEPTSDAEDGKVTPRILAFGDLQGKALDEASVAAVLRGREDGPGNRMKGYIEFIRKGRQVYGKSTRVCADGARENMWTRLQRSKAIIRHDLSRTTEMEMKRQEELLAKKIDACHLDKHSVFLTSWMSPSAKQMCGSEGAERNIPGKPSYDCFRVKMGARIVASKPLRPQSVGHSVQRSKFPEPLRRVETATGERTLAGAIRPSSSSKRQFENISAALEGGSPTSRCSDCNTLRVLGDEHALKTLSQSATRLYGRVGAAVPDRGLKKNEALPDVSAPIHEAEIVWEPSQTLSREATAERVELNTRDVKNRFGVELNKKYDLVAGAKKKSVNADKLFQEEQAYLDDVGKLLSVSIKSNLQRNLNRPKTR